MILVQIVVLLFWTLAVPIGMGAGIAAFVDKQKKSIGFMWIAGYILFMALFQLIAVPIVLFQSSLPFETLGAFTFLVWVFGALSLAVAVCGSILWLFKSRKWARLHVVEQSMGRTEKICFIVFGVLLVIQLVMAVLLRFGDDDDAYYVVVAVLAESGETMYQTLPYTGGTTGLDGRHALAPFPLLIAFWARVTGIHPAIVAHTIMPFLMIPLTYCVYGKIGNMLFKGKKKPLAIFMIFLAILILCGNYSPYTAETFLMIRSWQGKAVVANIMIPSAFLLLYMMGERLLEKRRIEKSLWFLLLMLVVSACLCSTQGGVLLAVLLSCFGVCLFAVYKKGKLLLPVLVCLLPAAAYLGLYLVLR